MNEKELDQIKITMASEGWKILEKFILWELARAKEELTKSKIRDPYTYIEAELYYRIGYFLGIKSLKNILKKIKCLLTNRRFSIYKDKGKRRFWIWQGLYGGLQRLYNLKRSFERRA